MVQNGLVQLLWRGAPQAAGVFRPGHKQVNLPSASSRHEGGRAVSHRLNPQQSSLGYEHVRAALQNSPWLVHIIS